MQKWEYMWIYVTHEKGRHVYVANGKRLEAQTNVEALNAMGKEGWELVTTIVIPQAAYPTQQFPQFCLKRPISD
jgi:Domain of unknown function (DUF4177)